MSRDEKVGELVSAIISLVNNQYSCLVELLGHRQSTEILENFSWHFNFRHQPARICFVLMFFKPHFFTAWSITRNPRKFPFPSQTKYSPPIIYNLVHCVNPYLQIFFQMSKKSDLPPIPLICTLRISWNSVRRYSSLLPSSNTKFSQLFANTADSLSLRISGISGKLRKLRIITR